MENQVKWIEMNEEIDSTAQRDIVIQRFSETEECMVNLVNEKRLPSRERSHIPPFGFCWKVEAEVGRLSNDFLYTPENEHVP